jgi:hypothetical protein
VIAWNHYGSVETVADDFQTLQTVVECEHIDTVAIIVKVTQKQTGVTISLFCNVAHPFYKVQAIFIVLQAVAFEPQMNIGEHHSSAE